MSQPVNELVSGLSIAFPLSFLFDSHSDLIFAQMCFMLSAPTVFSASTLPWVQNWTDNQSLPYKSEECDCGVCVWCLSVHVFVVDQLDKGLLSSWCLTSVTQPCDLFHHSHCLFLLFLLVLNWPYLWLWVFSLQSVTWNDADSYKGGSATVLTYQQIKLVYLFSKRKRNYKTKCSHILH